MQRLLAVIALLALSSGLASAQTAPPTFLIRDVRVFDGHRVQPHRSVLIAYGRIAKIGGPNLAARNAEVIDGRGRTLLPGLIDAHVHIANEDALRQSLAFGVTTDLDMFTTGDRLRMMKRIEANDPPEMADVRTSGVGATVTNGHPTEMGGPPFPTISSADEAQAFVDQRIAEGSDYIKIIYDSLSETGRPVPTLDPATLTALVAAAHSRHKLAVVHIGNESQARDVIAAGADGLAHMFIGKQASPDFGRFAAEHRVFVIPTLVTVYNICGIGISKSLLDDPRVASYLPANSARLLAMSWPGDRELCRGANEGMRQLIREHVPVLAGTDAAIPGTAYGASLHGELELLVKAGLSPSLALAAATSLPAHYFGLNDRGVIRPGARADLLLIDGDPTINILATRNIVEIWKHGARVERQKYP